MFGSFKANATRGAVRPCTFPTITTRRLALIKRFNNTKSINNPPPPPPPPLNIGKEHVNIMEEKAARAVQLHAELEALMEQNAKRRKETGGFLNFLKQNSSQFISIGVSFLCVVFAYQIVGMRQAGRKLMKEKEDLQSELHQERSVLQGLQQEAFLQRVAQKCAKEVIQAESAKVSWRDMVLFGVSSSEQQEQDVTNRLVPILKQELNQAIGDAGLSSEEKKQKIVAELQKANEQKKTRASADEEVLLKELVAAQQQEQVVQVTQDDDGTQIVKRRKFSI